MSILTRRARIAAVALTAAALVAAAPSAEAVKPTKTTNASGFVAHQLAYGGHHLSTAFDGKSYPDYGLTADAILAADAGKTSKAEATRATTYLGNHLGAYIGTGKERYAGATAKALIVALAQNRTKPGYLGGVGLEARLVSLMNAQGRFADQSEYGDSSNTFGQSLAIIGIKKAHDGVNAKAATFLLTQQCPGGGFRLDMAATKCSSASAADPDATSMAVQALKTVYKTKAVLAAITSGTAFLIHDQAGDGGFHGGATTRGVNSNSTSLALVALAGSGRNAAISKAQAYLRYEQYGCAFPVKLRGAVAYNTAAKNAGHKAGALPTDQDRRSSTQGVLGLGGYQLVSVSNAGARKTAIAMKCG